MKWVNYIAYFHTNEIEFNDLLINIKFTIAVCQTLFRSKKSGNREFFSQKSGGYQELISIKSNDFIQNYK